MLLWGHFSTNFEPRVFIPNTLIGVDLLGGPTFLKVYLAQRNGLLGACAPVDVLGAQYPHGRTSEEIYISNSFFLPTQYPGYPN